MKKTSAMWCIEQGILVRNLVMPAIVKSELLDPDGWNRNNFLDSFHEEITEKEFNKRLMSSTIITKGA